MTVVLDRYRYRSPIPQQGVVYWCRLRVVTSRTTDNAINRWSSRTQSLQ